MEKILNMNNPVIRLLLCSVVLLTPATGCKKYLNDVQLPTNLIAANGVFIDDASVASVVTGILYDMAAGPYNSGVNEISFTTGLYTDELNYFNTSPFFSSYILPYYTNNVTGTNTAAAWAALYAQIYECNVAIEGISGSKALLLNRSQYLGEAYVARAWLYFNLVNLYGGVPLAITSNYKTNNTLVRSTQAQVYAQIIADAKTASSLLPADFRDGSGATTTVRARPDKYMAEAVLARAYLYNKDWANAEAQATDIINNTTLFRLMPPAQTFAAMGNTEMIWGLTPGSAGYVLDYIFYNEGMPATIPVGGNILNYSISAVCMSDAQRNVFDNNDLRLSNWVRSTYDPNTNKTYYFPNKYNSNVKGVQTLVVARLAEIYLIRAEARAQQNNVSGAQTDINAVRTRAGLPNITAASQSDLLLAVEKERRCELFTEMGNRFFDLKRTGNIDTVMNAAAPLKGGTWTGFKQLLPISSSDILIDPNLVQNPGYN